MSDYRITDKNQIKRRPDRGHYDKATVYRIIDEALLCHIGFVQDGQPFVIPALHVRQDNKLLIHGASVSRMLKYIEAGNQMSISIAIVDDIVLAKAAFNQSINYRAVVLFGKGKLIEDEAEKLQALEYFTDGFMPGLWDDVRKPYKNELKATSIVSIKIEEASAKIRSTPPMDDEEDHSLPIWAGMLPIKQVIQTPVKADYTDDSVPVPEYVKKYLSER